MDLFLEILIGVCGLLISFGAAFSGVGYFKWGKKQAVIDGQTEELNTTNILRNDVDILQKQVKNLTDKIDILNKDNELKTRKLEEWTLIFQGRDPNTQSFMEMMKTYIGTNTPMLELIKSKTIPTIERLEKYLDKQIF